MIRNRTSGISSTAEWANVVVVNGDQSGAVVRVRASIRWWEGGGQMQRARGDITLQERRVTAGAADPVVAYRLHYVDERAMPSGEIVQVPGSLELPSDGVTWELNPPTRGASQNAAARVIRLDFRRRNNTNRRSDLERLQVTIPFHPPTDDDYHDDSSERTAALLGEALVFADLERRQAAGE